MATYPAPNPGATPAPAPGPGQYAQDKLRDAVKNANFEYHRDVKILADALKRVTELEQQVSMHAQRYLEYSAALAALDQIMPTLAAAGTILPNSPADIAELPVPTPQPLDMDIPSISDLLNELTSKLLEEP